MECKKIILKNYIFAPVNQKSSSTCNFVAFIQRNKKKVLHICLNKIEKN